MIMDKNVVHVTLTPRMAAIMRQALYVAESSGSITEADYADAVKNIHGIFRDPECEGRTFHSDPQHFC
jgi:hypothetical protein